MAEMQDVGLDYPINIGGNWSEELKRFRAEIEGMKSDLDAIKSARTSTGQTRAGGNGRVAAQQSEDRLLERLRNEQQRNKLKAEETSLQQQERLRQKFARAQAKAYRQELAEFMREQARIDKDISKAKERTSVEDQKREDRANAKRLRQQRKDMIEAQRESDRAYKASAQGRAAAIEAEAKTRQEAEKILLGKGLDKRGMPIERKTLTDRIKDFLGLANAQDKAETAGSRFLFTFRRLFGVLALFTIVRNITNSFLGMIRSMVTVNAELETMRLGMASLFVSVGQVRDTTGNIVSPMQGLAISLKEAQRQMGLLRKDSLQTTASFDSLSQAFQVAIAPGLGAGMNLDQIRTFAVRISQAADAIGLSQNQLAEEIRSILQGTIQARTTRIAVALGITNEDIRNARAAGTLVDYLQKKFSAFKLAGDEAMNTFNGVLNRVRNGFVLLLQEGGLGFFETVKNALKDVFGLLVQVNRETGNLEPNPKAVSIIKALGDGLSAGVVAAKEFVSSLRFEDVLEVARAVGDVIGAIPRLVGSVLSGLVRGMGSVFSVLRGLFDILKRLTFGLFDNKSLSETVALITKLVTYFLALRVVTGVFGMIATKAGAATVALTGLVMAAKALGAFAKDNKSRDFWTNRLLELSDIQAGMESAKVEAGYKGKMGVIANIISPGTSLWNAQAVPDAASQEKLLKIAENNLKRKDVILGKTAEAAEKQRQQVEETKRLKDLLDDLPGIITQARRPLSESAEVVNRIRSELDKVNSDLSVQRSTQGLSGGAADVVREVAESYQMFIEEQRKLNDELSENAKQRQSLMMDMQIVGSQFSRLTDSQRTAATTIINSVAKQEKIAGELYAVQKNLYGLEESRKALKEGDPAINDLDYKIAQEKIELKKKEDLIAAEKSHRQESLKNVDNAKAAVDAASEHLRVSGLLKTNEENRRDIQHDIQTFEVNRIKILQEQVRLVAEKGRFEAEQQNRILRVENEGIRSVRSRQTRDRAMVASGQAPGEASWQLAELNAQYTLEAEQFRLREETRASNLAAIDEELMALVESDTSHQSIVALEEYRVELQKQQVQEKEKELHSLEQMEEEIGRLRFAMEKPIAAGIGKGLQELVKEWTDKVELAKELTVKIVTDMADFISGAISDAFDPTKKVDLKQRFGQFLKGIADMMIQMLVRFALIKTLMATIPGFQTFALAAHDGGSVTQKFRKARGYAAGGRPSGLHPSDRIPIWTALGEWVIRASSVRKYGDRVMAAINHGLMDPLQLKALAGVGSGHAATGPGFAEGGRISSAATDSPASSRQYQQAVLLADEETNDRLAAGGKNAWLRMVSRNASEFRAAMGLR